MADHVTRTGRPGFVHPFAPSAWQRPEDSYRWLIEHDPLHHDTYSATVLLARFADCDAMLRDRRASASLGQRKRSSPVPESMLTTDPPRHTALRAIGTRLLNTGTLTAMQPALASRVAQVLDGITGKPRIEAMTALAEPIAVAVLATLLGIEPAGEPEFAAVARPAAQNLSPISTPDAAPRAAASASALAGYLRDHVTAAPDARLADWLETCSVDEAVGVLMLCVIGGLEPLTAAAGSLLMQLAGEGETPDDAAVVDAGGVDAGGVDAIVEQMLRRYTPIPFAARTAAERLELPGGELAAGADALVLLAAANLDATDRGLAGSLTFGAGPHFCLGAQLVRVTLRMLAIGVIERYERLQVVEPPTWNAALIPRMLSALLLDVTPRADG